MAANLISFMPAAFNFFEWVGVQHHLCYEDLELASDSILKPEITKIIEETLIKEHVIGSEYYERIQCLLRQLPETAEQSIKSLVTHRFKVIDLFEKDTVGGCCTGSDRGKYYLLINPKTEKRFLPFVISHEMSHILNEDIADLLFIKTINDVALSVLAFVALPFSFLSSFGLVCLGDRLVDKAFNSFSEERADEFAIRHCSKEELIAALDFFSFPGWDVESDLKGCSCLRIPSARVRKAKIAAKLGFNSNP